MLTDIFPGGFVSGVATLAGAGGCCVAITSVACINTPGLPAFSRCSSVAIDSSSRCCCCITSFCWFNCCSSAAIRSVSVAASTASADDASRIATGKQYILRLAISLPSSESRFIIRKVSTRPSVCATPEATPLGSLSREIDLPFAAPNLTQKRHQPSLNTPHCRQGTQNINRYRKQFILPRSQWLPDHEPDGPHHQDKRKLPHFDTNIEKQ